MSNFKKHPINLKAKRVFIANEDEFGGLNFWELVNGFESHFSTCPKAEEFRKK